MLDLLLQREVPIDGGGLRVLDVNEVADVQELVAPGADVDKRGADCRLEVHDHAAIDVADERRGGAALHAIRLELAVFDNRDSALLGFPGIDDKRPHGAQTLAGPPTEFALRERWHPNTPTSGPSGKR